MENGEMYQGTNILMDYYEYSKYEWTQFVLGWTF